MIFETEEALEDKIVRFLCGEQLLSVKELMEKLAAEGDAWSCQAVYKQLRKLTESQVVTKVGTSYSLDSSWVVNSYETLANTYQKLRIKDPVFEEVIAKGKKTWTFKSLAHLHPFWSYLVVGLTLRSETEYLIEWVPYPWWSLINRARKPKIRHAIRHTGKKWNILMGDPCFLTELCASDWPTDLYTPYYAPTLMPEFDTRTIAITSQFVIEVETTRKIANLVSEYFNRITSSDQLSRNEVVAVFSEPGKVRLSLHFDELRAQKYRRALQPYTLSQPPVTQVGS